MSEAACAKEIICDENVNQAQRLANGVNFLEAQIKLKYTNDPALILAMKKAMCDAMRLYLEEAEKAAAQVLDTYI